MSRLDQAIRDLQDTDRVVLAGPAASDTIVFDLLKKKNTFAATQVLELIMSPDGGNRDGSVSSAILLQDDVRKIIAHALNVSPETLTTLANEMLQANPQKKG